MFVDKLDHLAHMPGARSRAVQTGLLRSAGKKHDEGSLERPEADRLRHTSSFVKHLVRLAIYTFQQSR